MAAPATCDAMRSDLARCCSRWSNCARTITFSFSGAPTDLGLGHISASSDSLCNFVQVNATGYTAIFIAVLDTDISNAQVSGDSR